MSDQLRYAFGPYRLDPATASLTRDGRAVRLAPKDLELLLALLERAGQLVTHEQLIGRLWPDVVVDDANLTRHVVSLRKALGDDAEAPSYVETYPRRGYRFISPIRLEAAVTEAAVASPVPRRPRLRLSGYLARLGLGLVGVALGTVLGVLHDQALALAPMRSLAVMPVENLTGDPGQDRVARQLEAVLETDLGNQAGLQVATHLEAERLGGLAAPVKVLGRALSVDGLLEETIVRSDERIQVTAELVDTRSDRLVWTEAFEGAKGSVLDLQELVAEAVEEEVGLGSRQHPVATRLVGSPVAAAGPTCDGPAPGPVRAAGRSRAR